MNLKSKEELCIGALSRYDLDYFSYRQLKRDYIRFKQDYTEKFPNSFILRILINYMSYAQAHFLEKFEKDISDYMLEKTNNKNRQAEQRITFTKNLVEKVQEFDFYDKVFFRKRKMINFILKQFTLLTFSEREMVYFYSEYKTINKALKNSKMLLITISEGREFEVKPYCLEVDDNSYSYYLVGYTKDKYSSDDFQVHSLKLSRIAKCKLIHKEITLTYSEKNIVDKMIAKFGPAYIASNFDEENITYTVVRLTEYGYKKMFLKFITHQRPLPISTPEKVNINNNLYYDLRFECSFRQIHNYFFSFGKEVQIIEPEFLKNQFYERLQAAIENYKKTN